MLSPGPTISLTESVTTIVPPPPPWGPQDQAELAIFSYPKVSHPEHVGNYFSKQLISAKI